MRSVCHLNILALALPCMLAGRVDAFAQGNRVSVPGDGAPQSHGTLGPDRFRYGNVIYRVPEKMSRGRQDATSMVLLNDDHGADGFGYIYLTPGATKPPDPSAWLSARMAAVLEKDQKPHGIQAVKRQTVGKLELLMSGQTIGSELQLHAAVLLPTRIEHLYFEICVDEDHPEYAQRMSRRFTAMLGQIEFVSLGAKPVIPAPTPGPLHGTYFASIMGMAFGGMQTDQSIYLFSRSGRFFKGAAPKASLATLDPETLDQTSPGDYGHYCMGKNAAGVAIVELLFADGRRDELEFARGSDGGVKLNGNNYMLITPLADGARLNGTFASSHFQAFGPGGVSGGVGGSRSLTLKSDGTFEADRFSFTSATFHDGLAPSGEVTGGFTTQTERPTESGRYSIKDELLTLTARDGTVTTASIYRIDERMILLDGSVMIIREP